MLSSIFINFINFQANVAQRRKKPDKRKVLLIRVQIIEIQTPVVQKWIALSRVVNSSKSLPPCLVLASYSAWHFFIDGVFLKLNIPGLASYFDNSAVFKTF